MAEQTMGADWTTVIGSDVVIKGEITVEKGLRVDGRIEGSIATSGKVLVGKSGKLKADLGVGSLTVEGEIEGTIEAEQKLEVEPSGKIFGDITASQLNVKEGATVSGKVDIGKTSSKKDRIDSSKPEVSPSVARLSSTGSSAKHVA